MSRTIILYLHFGTGRFLITLKALNPSVIAVTFQFPTLFFGRERFVGTIPHTEKAVCADRTDKRRKLMMRTADL